jgi:hypothetical protein
LSGWLLCLLLHWQVLSRAEVWQAHRRQRRDCTWALHRLHAACVPVRASGRCCWYSQQRQQKQQQWPGCSQQQ